MYLQMLRFWSEVLKPSDVLNWKLPNSVVYENTSLKLRLFNTTKIANKIPILLLSPNAGHHQNIAEPLIERCLKVDSERPVYLVDWLEPTPTSPNRFDSIDDIVRNIGTCVEKIGNKVHLMTMCQGAWAGAIHAALRPETVATFVNAAGSIDFCAGGGKLQNICQTLPMSFYENMVSAGGGIQKGEYQLLGFKSLNPYERYMGDYVDLWSAVCEGDENKIKKWHRFKDWYDQPINLPGAWYLEAIDKLFKRNLLITGELEVLGQKVKLENINCPVFLIAGDKDDITLPDQVFNMAKYVSGPSTTRLLSNAGHIGVFTKSDSLNYWEEAILKKLVTLEQAEPVRS